MAAIEPDGCDGFHRFRVLQDLALYKKFREKEVASAARSLISLFREVAPSMLEKRDRGRDADLAAAPLAFGARLPASRVEGAELLQAALENGELKSDAEVDGDRCSPALVSAFSYCSKLVVFHSLFALQRRR